MGFENRYEGIDQYAVRIIKHKARQLVGKLGFTEADREDLEQEMIMDLLPRLPKYNPDRARRHTFIALVVENKVANIIEARKARGRDCQFKFSLSDLLEDKEGCSVERAETIDQDEYLRRTGRSSRPAAELRDLGLDFRKAVDCLPPGLRQLCRSLQNASVSEISRETKIPRRSIYESIQKLRIILEHSGLKKYL